MQKESVTYDRYTYFSKAKNPISAKRSRYHLNGRRYRDKTSDFKKQNDDKLINIKTKNRGYRNKSTINYQHQHRQKKRVKRSSQRKKRIGYKEEKPVDRYNKYSPYKKAITRDVYKQKAEIRTSNYRIQSGEKSRSSWRTKKTFKESTSRFKIDIVDVRENRERERERERPVKPKYSDGVYKYTVLSKTHDRRVKEEYRNEKENYRNVKEDYRNDGNSTLQCLLNTPGFSDFFKDISEYEISAGKYGIASAFSKLVKSVKSKSSGYLVPREMKSTVSRKTRRFLGYGQQDAQEFLIFLLEGISEDLNRVKRKPKYKELDYHENRTMQENADEWYEYFLDRENSIVTDYFSGQFMNEIVCGRCKNKSISFDNFFDISLSFKKKKKSYGYQYSSEDIKQLMDNFFAPEVLDDKFYCRRCKKHRSSTKHMMIYKLPKILVIQLKRFKFGGYQGGKILTEVELPEVLDLSDLVTESDDKSVLNPVYKLYAFVNHVGSLNGGHYTASCKNSSNGKWYNFNDSHVGSTSYNFPIQTSSAYIAFYHR